jgi:hypothetical protein
VWDDRSPAHLHLRDRRARSLSDTRWKLIIGRTGDADRYPLLFDRVADHAEMHDLAPDRPVRSRYLGAVLGWLESALEGGLEAGTVSREDEAELEDQLRALGYITDS